MNFIRGAHDIALALLLGGISGGALCALILFAEAPTREVAGSVGQVIFDVLGLVVLGLSVILMACRFLLQRAGPPTRARAAALAISALIVVLAAVIGLWLTPAMGEIWRTAPHAPDGSGLVPEARSPFMRMHGIANLCYVVILIGAASLILMRPSASRPR